jgi:hypothetical protein
MIVDAQTTIADAVPVAVSVDAAVKTSDASEASNVSSGDLVIDSVPSGAHLFLDGADQGVTPLKIPGSNDRHSAALVLPNHELYLAELDGRGKFSIKLNPVTPSGGPAGIKVRCKDKGRYYVFVDGKASGQLCPTEKIEVAKGDHMVEVYDLTTESRRQFPVVVQSSDRSLRVKVD